MASKGGQDAQAYKDAGKLLDYVSKQSQDINNAELTSEEMQQELGMSRDQIFDAYVVAHEALDYVSSKAPAEKAPDAGADSSKAPSAIDLMKMQRGKKASPEMIKKHSDLVKSKKF